MTIQGKNHLGAVTLALGLAVPLMAQPGTAAEPDRWANAMREFARQDEQQTFPPGGIVFVGSSSIRLWDLSASFPELGATPLNRGFGGSELSDAIRHVGLLVLKHRPRLVVVYAGDNDVAGGKSAEVVVEDFKRLVGKISAELPDTRVAYLAIKPSLARWKLAPTMRRANRAIRSFCQQDRRLTFVDVWGTMLGADGRPRPELFRDDGLHLNDRGYALWATGLRPVLVDR